MRKRLLSVFLVYFLVCAIAVFATAAFVQNGALAQGSAATISVTLSVTSGNVIVACGASNTAAADTFTYSDNQSGTWSSPDTGNGVVLITGPRALGCGCHVATATASTIFTISDTQVSMNDMGVTEFSGATCTTDGHNATVNGSTGVGGGQNMTSGAMVTTVNGDIIYAFGFETNADAVTVGTGFSVGPAPASFMKAEYKIQSTAASIAATMSSGNSSNYGLIGFALKASGGAVKVQRRR